jgi:hypothetical protein
VVDPLDDVERARAFEVDAQAGLDLGQSAILRQAFPVGLAPRAGGGLDTANDRRGMVGMREIRYYRGRTFPVALGQGATIHHGIHTDALFSCGGWRVAAYQSEA